MEEIKVIKDENKVNIEATTEDKAECIYMLAVALVGLSKAVDITESQLNDVMSDLWEAD